jgi:hypothetical protein
LSKLSLHCHFVYLRKINARILPTTCQPPF